MFDSGTLDTDDSFAQTFSKPGVYDYFCIPHEMAGMAGRIVVADPGGATPPEPVSGGPPLPTVTDILRLGMVARVEGHGRHED